MAIRTSLVTAIFAPPPSSEIYMLSTRSLDHADGGQALTQQNYHLQQSMLL